MKKFMSIVFAGVVTLVLSGCGGGSSTSSSTPEVITDFGYFVIQDSQSFDLYSVKGLEYDCGLGVNFTDDDGRFEYVVGSQCVFTFIDVDGFWYADITVDDIDLEVDLISGDYIVYDDLLFDRINSIGSEFLNFYM